MGSEITSAEIVERGKLPSDQVEPRCDSPSSVQSCDAEAEKKLVRKVDLHILPPLFILFFLAFLDRTNIGNAKIQGMLGELKMAGQDYSIALLVFFPPYILFEVPSNLIIQEFRPSTWLCSIMFLWGVCSMCQGLVSKFSGLVAMRFLIGLFEAGLIPGCIYLISTYYKRFELQWRVTIFFSASVMAAAFGGLFAYLMAKMDGVRDYSGWRWIFIVEGLITSVFAIALKLWLPDWPETAKFLSESERTMLLNRLADDVNEVRMDRLDKRAARRIFSDWKIWICVLMYLGAVNSGYAMVFFIPTIIQLEGFSSEASQIRSIPVFMVATAMSLTVAYLGDRLRHRYGFAILGVVLGSVGYVILLCQNSVSITIQYMACFFIASGTFIVQPTAWAWLSNNIAGHYKRSVATALQIGLGNIGGIIASNIFVASQEPNYTLGYSGSLGLLFLSGAASTVFFFGLRAENMKRERGLRDYRTQTGESELRNMGDDHPSFRFNV